MHVIGKAMSDAITLRGPDAGDVWQDPDVSVVLGHRRLSIIDLSPEGAQPMHSATERYVIAYNGEVYNFQRLKDDLLGLGVSFKGRSDTEVILAAIEHWGLNQALQKLNGMFAFALWDRKDRVLHFARDRMGKKPLYIGWAGNALVFGSELKAIHQHPDFEKRVDKRSLALYLRQGGMPAPHCIFEGLWQLPPAHRLSLSLDALKPAEDLAGQMIPYWDAVDVAKMRKPNAASESHILKEFEKLLTSCVSDRMISDVPLGAFLSGGIDSSAVVALMQRLSPEPIKTFTIGFEENDYNEAIYARQIADHLGTDHHEHICTARDVLDIIPKLPQMYDEPFADQSAIPTYLVSKFARESVTVALSGDGGDEMLGGYTRHITGPRIWNIIQRIPPSLRPMLARGLTKLSIEQWQSLRKHKPLFGNHMHKVASLLTLETQEDIYSRMTQHWQNVPSLAHADASLQSLGALPDLKGLSFAEKIMMWDTLTYLPHDILTKVDRASMAVSLEARAPLLDTRIFEYVWGLPLDLKIRGGKGKYLLRQVLKNHIPEALFERPKQGFNMPIGEWLRGDLRDWAEDLLNAETLDSQGFLDIKSVRATWDEHLKGQGNHTNALWAVLMFQAWYKAWM